MPTPDETFPQAVSLHQSGQFPQAETLYRQILATHPTHADALNMLGVLLFQTHRPTDAIDHIRRASALNPSNPIYLANLAHILTQSQRRAEAADAFGKAAALDPQNVDLLNNYGNALLASGQCALAADVFSQLATRLPDSPEIFSNLGIALMRSARPADAERAHRRSLQLRPDRADVYVNLGLTCGLLAKWDDAIDAFRNAIRLKPDYAEACNNLGNALSEQSRYAEAEPMYRRALELRPDYVQAHNNLGIALTKLGRTPESIALFKKALELRPKNRNVLYHLANALKEDGRPDEAIAVAKEVLLLKHDDAEALVTMSLIYSDLRRWDEAYDAARRALSARPDWAGAHNNMGYLLHAQNRDAEAKLEFEKAIELDPHFREAYVNLGTVYSALGRLDDAIASYERAYENSGESVERLMNLANTFQDTGRISEAIACCRRAAKLTTDPLKIQNYLLAVHYDPDSTPAGICELHRKWGQSLSARVAPLRRPHANHPTPGRRLRIGYVSPDFHHHVVAYNVLPLYENHDHSQFEIFAYSNVKRTEDEITARFRSLSDHWRNIKALSDNEAADLVRRDQIDILIDLALHTADNRIPLFARKPAPVQFTFAGYPATTGLPEIDYRLTDPHLDPPTEDRDALYTEKSIRLPDSFWCYRPLNRDQSVAPLPALTTGHITFGALTNFCKINPQVLDLWSKVLTALPTSKLHLIARPGSHRARTHSTLANLGVSPTRVTFSDYLPRAQYLEAYNQIDIGLDTFPYNGHTTSLDSYWMGVPVVTLVGETAVSRAGLCQLNNLGLPDLAAQSPDDFVQIAINLTRDLSSLATIRARLRGRLERSPHEWRALYKKHQSAYRTTWVAWCNSQQAG